MIIDRRRQVETLFDQVVSLPAGDRERLLAEACAEDPELRREVESLLIHANAGKNAIQRAIEGALTELTPLRSVQTVSGTQEDRMDLSSHGSHARPDSSAPSLPAGTRIDDYEIIGFIGAGGMGEVYRALDRRLRRQVAIKILPAFVSADIDRLRRFEQEARAAAALNHPNILAVFQMGSREGTPYLVSELLQGHTLREELPSNKPPSLGLLTLLYKPAQV